MEEGTKQDGSEWPTISDDERTLFEILFYSQGPVDGYILGEGVQDLFLKSGLPLRVLSQVWNLADVSNDNVLNVHEFVLVVHLVRGLIQGLKLPQTLPRKLTPPKTEPVPLQPATQQEKESYLRVFEALDTDGKGYLEGDCAREVFRTSGLSAEVLSRIWDLSDVNHDGKLDVDEFCLACHLLRFVKQGNCLTGPVDVFVLLPGRVADQSLQARKQRVQKYEQHKQKLMLLKEKRKIQVLQENQRLQLHQEKVDLLRQWYKLQQQSGLTPESEEAFKNSLAQETEEIEKQGEVVLRLKKEHEKIRQETVRIILAEQKLSNDIATIKKDTDELNKRLSSCRTHATKDPDPFHQFYEQRKEKRQGSTIQDLDKINIYLPFTFSPFDPGLKAETISLGKSLFDENVKHPEINAKSKSVIERLHGFGEEFLSVWGTDLQKDNNCDSEGDPLFKEVPVSMDEEKWLGLRWGEGGLAGGGIIGLNSKETEELQEKLLSLKLELQKLNQPGSRLVFRNPEDYYSRKRGQEEEDKPERVRSQRRSGLTENPAGRTSSGNNSPRLRDRHSYAERNEDASQAVREYRRKRQSAQSIEVNLTGDPDSSDLPTLSRGQETPKIPERPSRSKRLSSSSQIQKVSTEEESGKQTLSSAAKDTSSVEALAGGTSVSSSHFQPILTASDSSFLQSSGKKIRAPPPPSETTLSVSSSSENSSLQLLSASAPSPKQPAIQRTISNPSSSSESHNGIVSDCKISESQISAGIRSVQKTLTTESILIHSNTPEVQAQAETHIPLSERPARPKRRRDSQNTSNPSSPTDAVTQPPFSEIQTSVADKQSSSNVYSHQVHSKNSFELSEHFAVDVPNADGSVTLQPKITDDLIVIKSTSAPKKSTDSSTANSTESLVKVVLKETDLHRKGKTTDNFTNTKVTRAGPCASVPESTSRNYQFSPGAGPSIVHSLKEDLFPKNFEKVNTEIEEEKLVKPEAINSFNKRVPPSNPLPSVKKEDKVDVQYAQSVSDATSKWSAQLPESLVVGISTENSTATTESSFEQILFGLGEKQIKSEQAVFCVSETSSTCDSETESLPPPLPASPPPPLPTSPPPPSSQNYLFSAVDDKVIEVKKQLQLSTHKTKKKMEEANVIDIDVMLPESLPETNLETQKSIAAADLYSDVFGFNAQTVEEEQKHSTGGPFLDILEMPLKTETIHHEAGLSADSDVSDDQGHEGTYSLGDSSAQMSSLLMLPDNDGEIQLISFSVDQSEAPDKGDKHAMTTKQLESSLSTDSALGDSLSFSDIESKRPKSLEVKESNSSSSSDSCLSPTGSLSSQDMTALSPKSREIVEKARHFAEMVQKPNFVVKRESPGTDGLDQEALQDFEMERRAVIMQSTVRRKDVGDILSPSKDKNIFCAFSDTEEEVQQVQVKSSQELEDIPSPARSVSPEARWNDKQGKVIVYSENIVQEPDSSEAVDRESIANLASTRKQWETILSADIQEYSSTKPKKTPSKWEVRLSYKDRSLANSSTISSTTNNEIHESGTSEPDPHMPTVTSSNMAHIESAIERDIRLAHEREEMLRLEQDERMRRHQRSEHKMSSMESSTESELQPMYYELAEADRGADVWRQHEYEEPEEAMQRSSKKSFQKFGSNLKPSERPAESIIEREIRLQREREAELAQQRGYASPVVGDHSENSVSLSQIPDRLDDYIEGDNIDGQFNEITYEEAIIHSHTDGESLIAKELRELREREEEVRQQRKSIIAKLQAESLASSVSTPSRQQTESVQPAIVTKQQPRISSAPSVPRGPAAAARTPLVNVSVSRNMHASLHTDSMPQTQNPAPKQETPIEREIRLARERENELRRAKGLPELNPEPSEQDITKEPAHSQSVPTVNTNRRQPAPQPDESIRRFASNRLQQEILDQKKRELALRQEGKIITTSEEHIQPLKYSEITGQDKVDGTVKRNFKMPGNKHGTESPESVQDSPPITPQTRHSQHTPQRSSNAPNSGNKKLHGSGVGALNFSYREFRQTAESKIERELREMREREEELRKLHLHACDVLQEDSSESPAPQHNGQSSEPEVVSSRANIGAQWEQMCRN